MLVGNCSIPQRLQDMKGGGGCCQPCFSRRPSPDMNSRTSQWGPASHGFHRTFERQGTSSQSPSWCNCGPVEAIRCSRLCLHRAGRPSCRPPPRVPEPAPPCSTHSTESQTERDLESKAKGAENSFLVSSSHNTMEGLALVPPPHKPSTFLSVKWT